MSLLAAAPALPLHSAGKYVAGAYLVFVAILLIYVAIMAIRLSNTERELAELVQDVRSGRGAAGAAEPVDTDREREPPVDPDREREPVG